MQLLVSVANEADATEALAGGADWIDAKNPAQGPLGEVTVEQLRRICRVVGGLRTVSAALGDVQDKAEAARLSAAYGRCGAAVLKIGLARVRNATILSRVTAAAVNAVGQRGTSGTGIVAVAYADEGRWSTRPGAFVEAAALGGAAGVLLDTARKDGPGLCSLLPLSVIRTWADAAHDAGLFMAVAGRLTTDDLIRLGGCGADVAGVRGAACQGGRAGAVKADRVIALRAACLGRDPQARQSA